MDNLKETEWISINKVLLELYAVDDLKTFTDKVLKVFRMLIPYTNGFFILYDKNGNVEREKSVILEFSQEVFNEYIETYHEIDYIKFVFDTYKDTVVFRDTDIINNEFRKKTEFYQKFLYPRNIPFGAGIVLFDENTLIGAINLFRSGALGDFSDKDVYIFDVLKNHITNMILKLNKIQKSYKEIKTTNFDTLMTSYNFTNKEKEVAMLIIQGMTNAEIAQKMIISLSTVKKHVYNLFLKTNVKNRMQLTAILSTPC